MLSLDHVANLSHAVTWPCS